MRRLLAVAVLFATLSAPSSAAVAPEAPVGPVAYHPYVLPGALPKPGATADGPDAPKNVASGPQGPKLELQSSYVGRKSAEPTLGVDRDGVGYYAASDFDGPGGATARTELYRSDDGARTWQEHTPQVTGIDYPPTTLDPYVYVDQRTDRVYGIELNGAGSFLTFSDDHGATWQPSTI